MGEPIQLDEILVLMAGNLILGCVVTLMTYQLLMKIKMMDFFHYQRFRIRYHRLLRQFTLILAFINLGFAVINFMPKNRMRAAYSSFLPPYFLQLYSELGRMILEDSSYAGVLLKMNLKLACYLLVVICYFKNCVYKLACICIDRIIEWIQQTTNRPRARRSGVHKLACKCIDRIMEWIQAPPPTTNRPRIVRARRPAQSNFRIASGNTTMATTASSFIEKCALCLSEYKDPRFLPCFHTFCAHCIRGLASHSPAASFPCPVCRQPTTLPAGGALSLQKNFYIRPTCSSS